MKFTFSWLREFVKLRQSPQKIAEALTMAGLEVESLVPIPAEEGRGDWLVELAVTPNRGDCLGILGVAREVAALTGSAVKLPGTTGHTDRSANKMPIRVKILSPRLCPRYSGRMVQGVRVAPSPAWMRERLHFCGIRSVNNVVDTTNYVMLETGQPLHAFDAQKLGSGQIVVRQARDIKKFVTLDEIERELAPEDLLICDGDIPVALAGVMGGKESEVRSETQDLFLESAHFDPRSIRRTAKRLALHSEASHRFERGVDPQGTLFALDRAVFLLNGIAGGSPLKGCVDSYPKRLKPAPIRLRHKRVSKLLGIELPRRDVEATVRALGIKVQSRSKDGLRLLPPSYRGDLTREADVIEELARLHGYDKISSTLPLVRPEGAKIDARLRQERKIRSFLVGQGLTEFINLPFASAEMNRRFFGLWVDRRSPVPLLNPLVRESAEMRLSLLPGLLENLRTNLAQRAQGLFGFDLGKVFRLDANGFPEEAQHLAGLLYGQRERRGLRVEARPWTFLDAKGLVEGILELLRLEHHSVWTDSDIAPFLHPGKAVEVQFGHSKVGYVGEVHPNVCDELALPPVLVFELDFERMLQYPPHQLAVRSLPRFPSIERDLAVVVEEGFPAQRIIGWIKDLNQSLIDVVQVFDQYHGAPIPEGKKSLAYRISYRAEDRTLTDAEVSSLHQQLVTEIGRVFGAQLRD